jgi:hypothetical protein
MKLIVLFAFVAAAVAVPLDDKKPLSQPLAPLNNNKPTLVADPKAQAPAPAKAPLHKRDSPKPVDQKNTAPVTNTQKAQSVPSPVSSVAKPSNNRPVRDTQKAQDSYKPQASGVPQKTNVPTPTVVDPKAQNIRPARETPKAPVNDQKAPQNVNQKNAAPAKVDPKAQNTRPARETPKAPVNDQKAPVTPQKNNAPLTPAVQKPQNSRNRRDTVKPTEVQKPVEFNRNDKTKSVPAPSAPTADRKTRETPKTPVNNNNKAKTVPTQPEVAKVPLTSTNSRSRRDAPNPAEQSKHVPSGSISGKIENPTLLARKDAPASAPTNHKRDTQNIRRPVPVDQVLKQKNVNDEKPVAVDAAKPVENVTKKA